MAHLILRVCLLGAALMFGGGGWPLGATEPERATETKPGAPPDAPDTELQSEKARPEAARKSGPRSRAGSATGRSSFREGPAPPAPPPPDSGIAPAIKEAPPPGVPYAPPITAGAGALEVGPPAPGGMTRREGALEPTSLEDKLLQKGVLSREEWLEIKAEEERKLADRTEAIEFTGSPRWYERLRLYGYFQFRYNQMGHPNGDLISWQDRSVGHQNPPQGQSSVEYGQPGFFFRRIRTVLTGQVSDRVSVFLQTDFATQEGNSTQVATLTDAWGEYYFDQNKEYRLRIGEQRVPCSFDNWQATRQRMAIDRADATNSCAPGERDLGISFQWTPRWAQHRWKQMIDYMYGAGDWGMVNFTVYNGQGRNNPEVNESKHIAMRLAYPFELPGGRLMEIGMNANRGKFNVDLGTPTSTSTELFSLNEQNNFLNTDYRDEHLNFYIYYPPQPWGFIAEYITGRTPKRGADGIVRDRSMYGGYVQGHYEWKYSDTGLVNFYTRWQEYYGGLKFLTGAPDGRMKELEVGAAWMPDPQWEITLAYTFTQRLNFTQMTGPTLNNAPNGCNASFFIGGTPPTALPPDNSGCVPNPQNDAYGNLIRFQVMWFWN